VVWTINVVKGPASGGSLKVNGLLTLHNSGDAPAPIGNIVINLTHGQGDWGDPRTAAAGILNSNFGVVYLSSFGVVEVGIPGTAGFSMTFDGAPSVLEYLPAAGPIGPLTADLVDPTSTASGAFGGNVLALRLNVDFSAAGVLGGTGGHFGDLKLCNFTNAQPLGFSCDALTQAQADALNGQAVAQVLAEANTVLGGGTETYGLTLCQLDTLVGELSRSFFIFLCAGAPLPALTE